MSPRGLDTEVRPSEGMTRVGSLKSLKNGLVQSRAVTDLGSQRAEVGRAPHLGSSKPEFHPQSVSETLCDLGQIRGKCPEDSEGACKALSPVPGTRLVLCIWQQPLLHPPTQAPLFPMDF